MFAIEHVELEMIAPLRRVSLHRDGSRVLVQRKRRVLCGLPVEGLVGEVPVVLIVHVHTTDGHVRVHALGGGQVRSGDVRVRTVQTQVRKCYIRVKK